MPYIITVVNVSFTHPEIIHRDRIQCETIEAVKYFAQKTGLKSYHYTSQKPANLMPVDFAPGHYLYISGEETLEAFKHHYDLAQLPVHQPPFIRLDNPTKPRAGWRTFFAHPGNWVAIGLAALTISLLIGSVTLAPLFGFIAAAASIGAAVSVPFYLHRYWMKLKVKAHAQGMTPFAFAKGQLKTWFKKHPFQATVVILGIAAFITTLVLTIGFFTGGAGFGFMASTFAMISAPLIASSLVTGVVSLGGFISGFTASLLSPLTLAILSGLIFTIFPLNLANTLKRLDSWMKRTPYERAAITVYEDGPSGHREIKNFVSRDPASYAREVQGEVFTDPKKVKKKPDPMMLGADQRGDMKLEPIIEESSEDSDSPELST